MSMNDLLSHSGLFLIVKLGDCVLHTHNLCVYELLCMSYWLQLLASPLYALLCMCCLLHLLASPPTTMFISTLLWFCCSGMLWSHMVCCLSSLHTKLNCSLFIGTPPVVWLSVSLAGQHSTPSCLCRCLCVCRSVCVSNPTASLWWWY